MYAFSQVIRIAASTSVHTILSEQPVGLMCLHDTVQACQDPKVFYRVFWDVIYCCLQTSAR